MRASGLQRRQDILDAALRIMSREGLRAVSHRAVAAEAAVPLAATTYYFRDLEDLITEAFLHWSKAQRGLVAEFHAAALAALRAPGGKGRRSSRPAQALAAIGARYVIDQVRAHRGDRVLEFAFLHEAVRLPRLRAVVRCQQMEHLGFLEQFHAALGSAQAAVDAQISYSLLLGLEKRALLAGSDRRIGASVRAVLARHLQGVFDAVERAG